MDTVPQSKSVDTVHLIVIPLKLRLWQLAQNVRSSSTGNIWGIPPLVATTHLVWNLDAQYTARNVAVKEIPVLLSSRKVIVLVPEDQFTSPCPYPCP